MSRIPTGVWVSVCVALGIIAINVLFLLLTFYNNQAK